MLQLLWGDFGGATIVPGMTRRSPAAQVARSAAMRWRPTLCQTKHSDLRDSVPHVAVMPLQPCQRLAQPSCLQQQDESLFASAFLGVTGWARKSLLSKKRGKAPLSVSHIGKQTRFH
jgi:hypothetical protein